ncbi:Protein NRT1/ PTR FAMILY 5.2 [Hibiscus syriacus]|uniref:Protein NRT1/ PTR FAMILY 5.2 n=1 Tax=Hibiscus syriacus TaxID=106335 RepID=A0A6A3D087_HIBSY|nr:Protein NRT1/ PTR FAMILY 5.2 [Hibiscus syriacus]
MALLFANIISITPWTKTTTLSPSQRIQLQEGINPTVSSIFRCTAHTSRRNWWHKAEHFDYWVRFAHTRARDFGYDLLSRHPVLSAPGAHRESVHVATVIVAAIRKWRVPLPSDPKALHELDFEEYARDFGYDLLSRHPVLSAPGAHREIYESMDAELSNPDIGNFKIPPASLTGFVTISLLICVVLYDRFFVPAVRKWTKNPRGITLLQRMGVGLVLHIIIMMIASFTERYRLNVAKEHGLVEHEGQLPLTIFILLPQFVLMGTADSFLDVSKLEFFYDHAPESMKSLGTSYSSTSLGIGNFLSSFLLSTVSNITQRHGHQGWILNNLNKSHLDYYFAFFCSIQLLELHFLLGGNQVLCVQGRSFGFDARAYGRTEVDEIKGIESIRS